MNELNLSFSGFSSAANYKIFISEVKYGRKVRGFHKLPVNIYQKKSVGFVVYHLFFLIILFSSIRLLFLEAKKFIFIDIALNLFIQNLYKDSGGSYVFAYGRRYYGKLIFIPLRILSFVSRNDWIVAGQKRRKFLLKVCLIYLNLFLKKFSETRFFVRKDFYGEESLLTSISCCFGRPMVIGVQHGLMDDSALSQAGIYPGSRCKIQICYDNVSKMRLKEIRPDAEFFNVGSPHGHIGDITNRIKEIIFVGRSNV
jgi:hypothetical protein